MGAGDGSPRRSIVNTHQRSQRNARLRRTLMRAFVWFVLAAFISTIIGAGLITLGLR